MTRSLLFYPATEKVKHRAHLDSSVITIWIKQTDGYLGWHSGGFSLVFICVSWGWVTLTLLSFTGSSFANWALRGYCWGFRLLLGQTINELSWNISKFNERIMKYHNLLPVPACLEPPPPPRITWLSWPACWRRQLQQQPRPPPSSASLMVGLLVAWNIKHSSRVRGGERYWRTRAFLSYWRKQEWSFLTCLVLVEWN